MKPLTPIQTIVKGIKHMAWELTNFGLTQAERDYRQYWRTHSISGSSYPQLEDLTALRKRLENAQKQR